MKRVSKREIEKALRSLVPLSNSAQALIRLASDPKHEPADLIRVIERDASLTIRILALSNSSAFEPLSPVESVDRAVRLLGERAVIAAALEVGAQWIAEPLPGYGAEARLFADGLRAAIAAAQIARRIGESELAPVAYTAGLLHDVGKIVLSAFLEPRLQALLEALAGDPEQDWLTAEKAIVGVTHCEIGAEVAVQFDLPIALRQAIEHHHQPAGAEPPHRRLVEIVHVADAVRAMLGGSASVDSLAYRIEPAVIAGLGLDDESLSEVLIETEIESRGLLEAIGSSSGSVGDED